MEPANGTRQLFLAFPWQTSVNIRKFIVQQIASRCAVGNFRVVGEIFNRYNLKGLKGHLSALT